MQGHGMDYQNWKVQHQQDMLSNILHATIPQGQGHNLDCVCG